MWIAAPRTYVAVYVVTGRTFFHFLPCCILPFPHTGRYLLPPVSLDLKKAMGSCVFMHQFVFHGHAPSRSCYLKSGRGERRCFPPFTRFLHYFNSFRFLRPHRIKNLHHCVLPFPLTFKRSVNGDPTHFFTRISQRLQHFAAYLEPKIIDG